DSTSQLLGRFRDRLVSRNLPPCQLLLEIGWVSCRAWHLVASPQTTKKQDQALTSPSRLVILRRDPRWISSQALIPIMSSCDFVRTGMRRVFLKVLPLSPT